MMSRSVKARRYLVLKEVVYIYSQWTEGNLGSRCDIYQDFISTFNLEEL
jgi:hypothetical protein